MEYFWNPWNLYSYSLNSPLLFFDPDGEVTRVAVGGRTERNPYGHIAIEIDGTVSSAGTFYANNGPGGDWGVPLESYIAPQEDNRQTQLLTLAVSPAQEKSLEDVLKDRDPNTKVGLIKGSCVDVVENALESSEILEDHTEVMLHKEGHTVSSESDSFTPGGLANRIRNQGLVESIQVVGKAPKASWLRSFFNGIIDQISRRVDDD